MLTDSMNYKKKLLISWIWSSLHFRSGNVRIRYISLLVRLHGALKQLNDLLFKVHEHFLFTSFRDNTHLFVLLFSCARRSLLSFDESQELVNMSVVVDRERRSFTDHRQRAILKHNKSNVAYVVILMGQNIYLVSEFDFSRKSITQRSQSVFNQLL